MAGRKSVFNWQVIIGFVLVVTGGLFLVDQFLEVELMRNFWPLLVVLLGLTFFVGMILARKNGAWLAIPGTVIAAIGIILYIHNTFDLWITWTYAWALLISAAGIGMLIMNIYLKRLGLRKAGGWVIGIGLVLFVLFGIFFEVILDLAGSNVNSGVFLGSGLVLLGVFVIFSRFIFSTKIKKTVIEAPSAEAVKEFVEAPPSESSEPIPDEVQKASELQVETFTPLEEGVEFDQLVFDVVGDVFIEQGDTCSLRIEAEQELTDKINAVVDNGSLSIILQSENEGFKRLKWIGQERLIQYFVTVKSLSGLTMSGIGNIHSDHLSGESLRIIHLGEGKLILQNLIYQKLQVSLEGLGEIELDGDVQSQTIDLSGLGSYDAQGLRTQVANVVVSGAGTALIWVEEALEAALIGAGSIRYRGQPAIQKTISGLGNIKPLEIN